jgi:hypothetical protein
VLCHIEAGQPLSFSDINHSTVTTFKRFPFDVWRIIIEYLDDGNLGCGYRSLLPYRTIDKTFSETILECIKEVRIIVNFTWRRNNHVQKMLNVLLSRPLSLRKLIILLKVKIPKLISIIDASFTVVVMIE